MSNPVPAGMMRTRGGVRIAARPIDIADRPLSDRNIAAVIAVILGIEIELTIDDSHTLRDMLHDAELRAARGDVIT